MQDLVRRAVDEYLRKEQEPVYTVSIWTDPDARSSSVSIDTWANSDRVVLKVNAYNEEKRRYYLSTGDAEMAELFGFAERNCSPADFAYRDLAECEHRWMPENWAESTDGECWHLLLPALRTVATCAIYEFQRCSREPGAVLAINSPRDWFDEEFPLLDSPT